jgi:cytochrome c oxidase cbb3-type subunit 2/cytochrome c oxidase cbb3-type subunit I/II
MRKLAAFVAGVLLFGGAWASVARGEDGKELYTKSCTSCHGATGKGDGPASKAFKTMPADLGAAVKGKSEADVVKFIKEGKPDLKPPHKKPKLTDEEIQAVAKYVKTL